MMNAILKQLFRPHKLTLFTRSIPDLYPVAHRAVISSLAIRQSRRLSTGPTKTIGSSVPGVKTGTEKYIIAFTCKVCDKRSAKTISKQAYHHGCVVVRCPQCQNLHLIVDNLGVFEEKGWNVQKYLGDENFSVLSADDILELTKKRLSSSDPDSNNQPSKSEAT
jgi:protein import protein ZIM17